MNKYKRLRAITKNRQTRGCPVVTPGFPVKFLILSFILLFSCKIGLERIADKTQESKIIRVKLTIDKGIKIKLNPYIIVEDSQTNQQIKFKFWIQYLDISVKDNNLILNDKIYNSPIKIYSKNFNLITINNTKYFGVIKVIPKDNELKVINYIPIETYLMSVLFSEVPASFEIEALKAQAIVARTYAYLCMNRNAKKRDFDLDDTVNYQVYNGFEPNLKYKYIKKLEEAINGTSGLIVAYNDKPITAYFHSNSGGITRSGKDYFGSNSDLPYLIAKDDPYSIGFPGDKWKYNMSIVDFLKALDLTSDSFSKSDLTTDNINDTSTDSSSDIIVVDKKNIFDISSDNFSYYDNGFIKDFHFAEEVFTTREIRKTIGYSLLKSERFKIDLTDDELLFDGIGYGHGVGMSQWGAQGMAEKKFTYKDIIEFYYPNTQIISVLNEN